ncbi:hypothetical protein [Saccharothrix luteola]|uniref:hypothetical protein n=1 Tax=Saccharothrix luteola TaxID=2893018 RepID=UPI001E60CC5A|nr:hypothetical protein [Saccharothrix luteola]MCC8246707.1 hypothetical protein [Saccharothrix luteola]
MLIIAPVEPVPPNFPAAAGFFSQLAGVMAGFAFASLITLIAAQLTTNHSAGKTLESGGPLLATFVALGVSSLDYAMVAGETAGTARVASLLTVSGVGFGVAGIMLLYSMLVLVRGLESDAPRSRAISHAMGNLIRAVIVFLLSPVVVLLTWSGARGHVIQKYGAAAGFTGLDWAALSVLLFIVVVVTVCAVKFFDRPQHHPAFTRFISGVAVVLTSASVLGATALLSFTESSTPVPDPIPLVAIILVGSFAVLVAYSASRLRTASDNSDTPVLPNDHAETSLAPDDGTASEVSGR